MTALEGLAGAPTGSLAGARLEDGTLVELDAVVVAPYMRARSAVLDAPGLRAVEHPSGLGEHYPADPMGRTSVEGALVAGDVTDLAAQVGAAGAAGAAAGALLSAELIEDDLAAAAAAAATPA